MTETASASLRILTLQERLQWLRNFGATSASFDGTLADKRLARWRAQAPYNQADVLEKRLLRDGLNVAQLRLLLGLSGTLPQADAEMQWCHLVELWKARANSSPKEHVPSGRGLMEEGFALIALPAMEEAEKLLRERISAPARRDTEAPLVSETALFAVGDTLRQQVREITTRTMVLEMHVAKAQGQLTALEPEQRYREFLSKLLDPEYSLALLAEYAVMARLLDEVIAGWLSVTSEIFERLANDWLEIRTTLLALPMQDVLTGLAGGAGDLHRGRRSVHILTFASGARLVYKPRSLQLDDHFAAVCHWLKGKDASLDLRVPQVLYRQEYGWSCFVAMQACETQEGVQAFYRRLGALLALLHVLQATDFHYENVIAAGEYPTPIDLEALLHARMDEGLSTPMGFFRAIQEDSVVRVGLLPRILFSQEGRSEGIDISGMGGQEGQMSPTKVMVAEAIQTDEMRIVRRQVRMEGSKNQPRLGDRPLRASAFVEQIIEGFAATSEIIRREALDWLGPTGLLQGFAEDRLRLVVRPTMVYAKTLHEGYHPNLLRDAVDRDRLLERLWLGCVQRKQLEPFFRSEMRDLSHGEVPAFFFHANSRQVWDAADQPLGELLEQPTLRSAEAAVISTQQDSDRQQWWIRATLAASETTGLVFGDPAVHTQSSRSTRPAAEYLLEEATKIGERLLSVSETHGRWMHWHGLHYYAKRWNAGAVGVDLYNGSSGIGLFLAYLGKEQGASAYTNAARAVFETSTEYLQQLRSTRRSGESPQPGALWGESGLCLALQRAADLWQDAELSEQAVNLLKQTLPLPEASLRLSVGSGLAGFVAAAVCMVDIDADLLRQIERACEALVRRLDLPETAKELDQAECLWLDGWCGVGHTLFLAGDKLENAVMRDVGLKAFHRGLKDAPRTDQNSASVQDVLMRFGPDSGFVWKAVLDIEERSHGFGDRFGLPKTRFAVSKPASAGVGLHHGLCSQIDLLLDLHLHSPETGFLDDAVHLSEQLIRSAWRCDTPAGIETPGLMAGLAGIGSTLLRCAAPQTMRLFNRVRTQAYGK